MARQKQFQTGDRVWFKVLGRVIDVHPDVNAITIDDDGRERVVDLDARDVELQAPSGWPPQAGDVWFMSGQRYFAIRDNHFVSLIGARGHRLSPADVNLSIRDLTLVDREQQGGAQ